MSKRRHARALAAITVVDVSDAAAPAYQARDIGIGGLFLYTAKRWPIGITRRLALAHGAVRLEIDARVVRSSEQGAAMQFVDPSAAFLSTLRALLVNLVYEGVNLAEHRDAHRFRTTSPVLWSLGSAQYRTTLQDLSSTGATIVAQRPPAVGAEIYVQLPVVELRAGVPVVEEVHGCRATVVRHTDAGFAVRFKGTTDGFRHAVRAWAGRDATAGARR
jgi:hypothetical protein